MKGIVKLGKLEFEVKVLEERHSFGRKRYLVEPVSGKGQAVMEIKIIK